MVALEEPVVRGLIGDPRGLRVADIGCGTGRHARWLVDRGAHVIGVDFSGGMLDVLRRKFGREDIELLEHDLSRGIPLESQSVDVAISCLVLEHVADLDAIVAEMARICRPGGRMIVSDLHPEMVRRGFHARFREAGGGQKFEIAGGAAATWRGRDRGEWGRRLCTGSDVVLSYNKPARVAARKILLRGGNAFDAVVAATFVEYVYAPEVTSLAGPLAGIFYSAERDHSRSATPYQQGKTVGT